MMDKLENKNTQQTVYTKWFNNLLKKVYQPTIDTLMNGFRSGRRFYSISNVLCETEKLEIPEQLNDQQLIKKGIENILAKFNVSLSDNLKNKLDDFVNGDEAPILPLAWWMISEYFAKKQSVQLNDIHSDTLLWCQQIVKGYRGVNVTNFTNSWRDGCALLAVLHFHKTSMFDFESRLSKNSGQNLTLALHLANQEFSCMNLLEVDNFTLSLILDWKCICLYLMELRQCIKRKLETPKTLRREITDDKNQLQIYNPSFESLVADFQQEFSSTLSVLETIFQQLETAENRVKILENIKDPKEVLETFSGEDDLLFQFKLMKESVVEHESLMEKLTKYQDSIQTILMKGNGILEMTNVEKTEQLKTSVKKNLQTTTDKWNNLYNNSITFQRKLHKLLSLIQMSFLIKIQESIDQLEETRKSQTFFGNGIDQLKEQLKINSKMEMKIESTEKFISALKTFVIFDDDSDISDSEGNSDDKCKRISKLIADSSFEERIQLTGNQWSSITHWVSSRYKSLQNTLLSWRHFEEEIQGLFEWLEERICTADQLLRKSSRNQFNDFVNFTESKWGRVISNLDKCGQNIKNACDNESQVVAAIDSKIDEIIQEWTDVSEKWRDSLDNWPGVDSKKKSTRAASFSDMCSDNYFDQRKMENIIQSTPISLSDMNINTYSTQAGYKTKFEKDAELMMIWLENSAEKLELITLESLGSEERPSIDVQKKIIDTVTNEINTAKLKKKMEAIKKMGAMYQEDLNKQGENTDEIEQLFEELDERWSYLENQLIKSRQKVLSLEFCSQLESESNLIDTDIKNCERFLENIQHKPNQTEIDELIKRGSDLREKLINKKNVLKQFTDKYQVVKSDLTRLNEDIFTKQIVDLNHKLINHIQIIENEQIKMRNTRSIMEMNLVETDKFLKESSEVVNEKWDLNAFEDLKTEVHKYEALQCKLDYHAEILMKINTPHSSTRKYKILMEMQGNCQNLKSRIETRVNFLKDLLERTEQWKNQTYEFDQWLEEVRKYLDDCENQKYVENDVIIETIKETEAGISDMENLIPTLENIEISSLNLETYFGKDLKLEAQSKKKDLKKKWDNLHNRYVKFKEFLETQISKHDQQPAVKFKTMAPQKVAIICESELRTEDSLIDMDLEHTSFSTESLDKPMESSIELERQIFIDNETLKLQSEIQKWIENSSESLTKYSNIHSTEQLNAFGGLVNELQKSKENYAEKLKEISSNSDSKHLNESFTNFSEFLDSEHQRHENSAYHLKDVKNILSVEDKWLGKVDRVMQQSFSCDHLDVEKLSENIDEIEKVVCDHSEEDFNRLEDLKYSLMTARVLERSVSMEIEQIKEKSLVMKDKATKRLGSLQQVLEHVQSVERRVCQMTTWIYDTTNLLKARIVADMLGSDIPDEFEILKQNFSEWEKFLVELEDLEQGKRFQGRKETSERLRLQRMKLQKSFRPLKEMFSRFSRPADFEPRLDNLKREVNRVAEHIYLLDIISISVEDLENCQTHAKQFKETLLGAQDDLNYVYDLGKKIAERKEIEFPERFSLRLDGLKKQYYDLIDQINEAEQKLIAAKPLVEEISQNLSVIDEILEKVENDEEDKANMDSIATSYLLELSDKLKSFTDYDNSELVRDMFDEVKEKCELLNAKKQKVINKRMIDKNLDQLHDEADQLIAENDNLDFSDDKTIEGKFDSLYNKTNQIKQVASQIICDDEIQKNQGEFNKYLGLQQKLERIITSISSHQITNGHHLKDDKIDEKDIFEESFLSTCSSSLQNEMEFNLLKSRENSFGDSLSSPYSVEDISSNENVVSDLAYSVQAAKIEKNILNQVLMEIKDHIHSFIIFCQNNLGPGMALVGSSSRSITTLNELKFKINCVKETITEIFREQRFYIDHRLRELSAYADTSDQLEELDKIQRYWMESIGKLNKRIGRLTDLNKRMEEVEVILKEYELQPSEKLRSKALRLVSQIEEELNVNLQKDRLRLSSCGRLGSQDISLTKSVSSNSVTQIINQEIINSQDNYRENLKSVREQLKEIGRRLNSVRIYMDDSRRGCLSKLSERIQEIGDTLSDCSHMLADLHYTISPGSEHQNSDLINLNFLVEAQKKRLGKYHAEFQTHLSKWMENASRWQEFVEKLEKLQTDLFNIEQDLITIGKSQRFSDQKSGEIKKSLNLFEKKLVLLEQDGDNLSISCNDVDADFLRNRLSDLRSRYTICLPSNQSQKIANNLKKFDETELLKNNIKEKYNGNCSDFPENEILSKNCNELTESRSSELDLNANSIHSSQDSLPNEDYETSSGDSSEELSTMIDGAATVLAGKLNIWAKLNSDMILKISVDDFQSIDDLEENIIEITKVKKETLEKTAQITMGLEKQSTSENSSVNAELSSQITEDSNSQLLLAYQDLKNILFMKTNELSEIKVKYYHIQDHLKKLETIADEVSNNYEISDQLLEKIKTSCSDSDIRLLEDLIIKMPKGLRQNLEVYFQTLGPMISEIQTRYFDIKDTSVNEDGYGADFQMTQENINQIALLLKSINTFMVNSKINLGQIEDIVNCLENIHIFNDKLEEHKIILQSILEKKALYSGQNRDSNFAETIDKVDRLWNSTKEKLNEREHEIINMQQLKFKLTEIELSLRQWMEESEDKLNKLLSEGLSSKNQKILDDVKIGIPSWQQSMNDYQSMSYELTNSYSGENCLELESNLEQMNKQWSTIMNKLAQCTRELNSIRTPQDQTNHVIELTAEMISSNANDNSNGISIEKLSGWLSSLEGQLETIEIELIRWRNGSGVMATGNTDKLKFKLINQLNELQNDVGVYKNQFQLCSESEDSDSEYEISKRWKIFNDKINEMRQCLEITIENGQTLLTKMRLLNDWLAHKEAEMLEQKGNTVDTFNTTQEKLLKFETFIFDIESHRTEIENVIEQAQNQIGESFDSNKLIEQSHAANLESEGESENSDLGSNGNITDDKSKRLQRRLRRHSHYMKRKWIELNLKMRDFHEYLKKKTVLLKSIDTQMKEVNQILSELEFHIDNWTNVANIKVNLISQEISQTKIFLQSTQPLIEKMTTMEIQKGQLESLNIPIGEEILKEFEKINSRISYIKSLCEMRIKQLHQQEQLTKKQTTTHDEISIFQDFPTQATNSIPRKIELPSDLSENRKFVELENESVSYPWERCLHPSGSEVPYYKNHSTQDTQWDHPMMADLIKSFDELNTIRFSAYRTAMKLRALQKVLCLDVVDMNLVTETFRLCGVHNTSVNERLLDIGQIIVFLASLYRAANQKLSKNKGSINMISNEEPDKSPHSILGCARGSSIRQSRTKDKSHHTRSNSFGGFRNENDKDEMISKQSCIKSPTKSLSSKIALMKCSGMAHIPSTRMVLANGDIEINVPLCVDLGLNWLLNVYDSPRNGKIRVLSLKTAIVILTNANLEEKYKYLFSLVCNNQGQLDASRLTTILTDCVLIPKHLNESSSFGAENVKPSVNSCFKNSSETGSQRFIRLSQFLAWLRLEPQSLVWLPVLNRIISAESAVHQAKCGVCKAQPIVGLRYRCLRCLNFDLCQACFFYSKTAKSHKVSHPMQEYCNVTSSRENFRDYSRIFRNRFRSKSHIRRQTKLSYLPLQNGSNPDNVDSKTQSTSVVNPELMSTNHQIHSRVEQYANRLAEVEQLNKSNMIAKSESIEQKYEPSLLSQDFNGKFRDLLRTDEEHQIIFKHTEMLRKHQRNKSLTLNNTSLPSALQSKKPLDVSMENAQTLPPIKNTTNLHYNVPQYQNIYGFKRYAVESENVNQPHLSNSAVSSYDDLRVPNSNSSLNQVIHGLETQKRQLMAEYERLQLQTPTNNLNSSLNPMSTDSSSRYASLDFGFSQGNRNAPYNHSIPPISSRKASRSQIPISPNNITSLDRSAAFLPPSEDLVTEARILRQHKGRLEARMGMLEQHNRQLEAQLSRLRQLIDDSPNNPNHFKPALNIVNSFLPNSVNINQDPEILTAAQYAASKRINEISSICPVYNNNLRYQGVSGNDPVTRNYQNPQNIYSGTRSTPVQNVYGSLERGSSFRGAYETNQFVLNFKTPVDRLPILTPSSSNYISNNEIKSASDTGGSLSESEFQLMCRSLADSCPAVTTPIHGQSTNSIGSLFHMAGQVGKAVGQLVNVMTDDFNNNPDNYSPGVKTPTMNTNKTS